MLGFEWKTFHVHMPKNFNHEEKRIQEKTKRRDKKKKPKMKVSGRGMKRFAKPKKD